MNLSSRLPDLPKNPARFTRPLLGGVLALLVSTAAPTAAQQLPALGSTSSDVVSAVEEERLGRQFMRNARRQLNFSDDPLVSEYITALGGELALAVNLSGSDFTFSVVNDPNLNAFAVPGGFISVHSGLIAETASEGELASVMAHEIAHITQRHLPRMIARAKQRSLPAAAAMVAAILVGGQVGSAALVGANAALAADQLQYNRDFEKEADAVGIRILAESGFNPADMPSFFQKLQKGTMLQGADVPEYLRTHPLSVSRIADTEARVGDYPPVARASSYEYLMMRARVRAQSAEDPLRAAGYFTDIETEGADEAFAARYGEALSYLAAGQYDRATTLIEALAGERPDDRYVTLARGEVALRAGRIDEAVERFSRLYENDPGDVVLARYLAESHVAASHWEEARRVLRKWQRNDPDNPYTWWLLSRVDGELGRRAESFQARAEYYAGVFETARAIEELERARQYSTGNYYLASSIDARITELREEQARFSADGKG